MALTRRACSWATHKRLSVSRLSSPRFSHSLLFLSSVFSVSLKNWPSRAFSFHSIRRCFILSCLFWTFINILSFRSVVAAMVSNMQCLLSLSSLTQSSMLTSHLSPSHLSTYTLLHSDQFLHHFSTPFHCIQLRSPCL